MPRRSPRSRLFPLVSATIVAVALPLLAGCQATPSAGSDTPITEISDAAAAARSPLDDARLVAAELTRTGDGVQVTAYWLRRGGRVLVVRDGVLDEAGATAPPAPMVVPPEVIAGLARYEQTPEVAGLVTVGDRTLALVTGWRDAAGQETATLFRGLWASDPGTVARWTPYAVPDAEGPGITSVGAASRGLLWVTTADGRLVVSTDAGRSFSELPARPSP